MLFAEEYDTSLSFILKTHGKEKREVVRLISELPNELIDNIQIACKEKRIGVPVENHPRSFYRAYSKTEPDIVYWFSVDHVGLGGLEINKSRVKDGDEEEIVELLLMSIEPREIKQLSRLDNELWIGSVTYDMETNKISDEMFEVSCLESEYNLINTPIGLFISCSKELRNGFEFTYYKPIGPKIVPKEIGREKFQRKRLFGKTR